MTPKEKAKDLVNKMDLKQKPSLNLSRNEINLNDTILNAKQCALIAVDEIINSVVITDLTTAENQFIYWEEVKQEIINL
jgi:hypothetical protein